MRMRKAGMPTTADAATDLSREYLTTLKSPSPADLTVKRLKEFFRLCTRQTAGAETGQVPLVTVRVMWYDENTINQIGGWR